MESEDSETDWGKSLQFYMMIHDSHLTPSQNKEKKDNSWGDPASCFNVEALQVSSSRLRHKKSPYPLPMLNCLAQYPGFMGKRKPES